MLEEINKNNNISININKIKDILIKSVDMATYELIEHELNIIQDFYNRRYYREWWDTIGDNPFSRTLLKRELIDKYFDKNRITSSLTDSEIFFIYLKENKF